MGCFGTLRASFVCVCFVGVSSCPLSYLIFSSGSPARALSAALCLFFEALRVLCVWRCRLWTETERLGERCPVPASLPSKTASLEDLAKSVWLKPTQTFIYLLERSCGTWRPAF